MPSELEVTKWIEEIDVAAARIGPRFSRKDLRAHSAHYLRGLMSRIERKNGWQLAEELGEQTPTNLSISSLGRTGTQMKSVMIYNTTSWNISDRKTGFSSLTRPVFSRRDEVKDFESIVRLLRCVTQRLHAPYRPAMVDDRGRLVSGSNRKDSTWTPQWFAWMAIF